MQSVGTRRYFLPHGAEVEIFSALEELSFATAKRFQELARQAIARKNFFASALSGGTTPKRLYELLAQKRFQIPWDRVHLFQVDERCVPPDHAESNYRMVREALLSRVALPEGHFHRMLGERTDREEAARQYARELTQWLSPKSGEWPRFDLIFLGMGSDGHTASLFPGSPALGEQSRAVSPNFTPKLTTERLTLTYPVLNAAEEIIFLVSGSEKAEALHQVLEGRADPARYPAQGIRPINGCLRWFVDEAAARTLHHPAEGSP